MKIRLTTLLHSISITLLGTLLTTCIDPFLVNNNLDAQLLTVDGLISTAPGPHKVRLTLSNNYNNQFDGNTIMLRGANVAIRDEYGHTVQLEEEILPTVTYFDSFLRIWRTQVINRPTGVYHTPPTFKAQLGVAYSLQITTSDGKQYMSLPEKVQPVATMEHVAVRPYKSPSTNPFVSNSGVFFDVTITDPPGVENFYMWRPSHAWGILRTFPELLKYQGTLTPKSCCNRCFLEETRMDGTFAIQDDRFFDGLTTTIPSFFVQEDGFRFMERYRVQVNQYSISERAFQFLQLVKKQLEIQGSVFDPPPANIRGNIVRLDQPEEQALGYFFVTDVSSKMMYINRQDIPEEYLNPIAVIEEDCREFFGFTGSFMRTQRVNTIPPVDWEF